MLSRSRTERLATEDVLRDVLDHHRVVIERTTEPLGIVASHAPLRVEKPRRLVLPDAVVSGRALAAQGTAGDRMLRIAHHLRLLPVPEPDQDSTAVVAVAGAAASYEGGLGHRWR